jgi:hypothetical protein
MKLFPAVILLLFLTNSLWVAQAGNSDTITLYPVEGHSNQNQINEALENYDEVILSSNVFEVDNPVIVKSGKKLKGEKGACLRVWNGSDEWNNRYNGVIRFGSENLHDVTICGIEIDGNCDELPASYANFVFPGGSGHHNAWRGIVFSGTSNPESGFMYNISIHDMYIHDFFSDGIRIAYADNVYVYDNVITNTQHECIYFICVRGGIVQNNELEGITSDNVRFDNCVDGKIVYNYLSSYTGDHNNGETKGRHQGIQIADQGRSFDSGNPNQPLTTTNIEITQNTLVGEKKRNFWIDSTGYGVTNVYIHDNKIVDGESLETDGFGIDGLEIDGAYVPTDGFPEGGDISDYEKTDRADDINNNHDLEFTEDGYVQQGEINAVKEWEKKGDYTKAYIFLAGYDGQIEFDNQSFIPKPASECAIVKYETKNLAEHSTGQTSELTLSDKKDGSLKAALEVKTKWKVKKYKVYDLAGIKIKIPYWEKKSETVTYTKTYPAPLQFPKLGSGLFNVTVKYYNSTYNPYTLVTVQENENQTQFKELITFIEYKYKNTTAKEFRQIGYVGQNTSGYKKAYFKETSTWKIPEGQLSHSGRQLYITGPLDLNSLEVIVHTPYTQLKVTDISYSEVTEEPSTFFEKLKTLFWILLFFAPFIYSICAEFKIVFPRFRR